MIIRTSKGILNMGVQQGLTMIHPESKNKMIERGNQKSLNDNKNVVCKTLSKEQNNSHTVALPMFLCCFALWGTTFHKE
jgi:hypothetical protein